MIKDGYYFLAKLAKSDFYEATSFLYRPMLVTDREEMTDLTLKAGDRKKACQVQAECLASRIARWNAVGLHDEPVEPTAEGLLSLAPRLYDVIAQVIMGELPPDELKKIGSIETMDEETLGNLLEA